ncbi:MAG TPA: very short patch repair endonuclease [Bacteroidia bacterium]|jgi:DNA mismatch endonuclease (patch repair protein)|nr:very short patch repair endonuclease [Bacteroidia bacterium]
MADVHTNRVRSYNMSMIRSKDTKPELIIRRFLFTNGFRFRLHVRILPGKPDVVLRKLKTAIFVHGCFWHGHEGCKYFVVPKTRTDWWLAKIKGNISNDAKKKEKLKEIGWNVITIWECSLRFDKRDNTLNALLNQLCKLKNEFKELN